MTSGSLHPGAAMAAGALFTLLLALACVSDARTRRIPNGLVLLLAAGGLAHALLREPGAAALPSALAAMAIGFAVWIPFHAMRMLGAGDVKLFAAASAWLVPSAVPNAALVTGLAGGVLSLLWMLRHHGGRFTLFRLVQMASVPGFRAEVVAARELGPAGAEPPGRKGRRLPYGIAMAIGLLATVWLPYHLV